MVGLDSVHQSIQGRPRYPRGFYLARYILLKEKLRVLYCRIQPDVVQNPLTDLKQNPKHTTTLVHFIGSFSRTGKYQSPSSMEKRLSGPLSCLSVCWQHCGWRIFLPLHGKLTMAALWERERMMQLRSSHVLLSQGKKMLCGS